MKTVSEILLDLVAIPSVSPADNAPVVDYITACLDPAHWNVARHPHRDPAGTAKTNLVAVTRNGAGPAAELALVCHMDTVPFDAGWNEAVQPAERDGRIYGRGSCDVKGYLACILAAVQSVDSRALRKPLALVFTADEEVGCIGAKHLAAAGAFTSRHMIIGEPTSMQPVRAGKGYALATIVVKGKEGHSAFPSEGHSAIYDAARIVTALEEIAKTVEADRNEDFAPPYTTLNVGLISGGTAKNIVPGECRITVEWRPIPGQDPEWVARLIRDALTRLHDAFPGFDAEFAVLRNDPAFAPSKTDALVDWLSTVTGNRPGTISFGSEAAHLRALSGEIVVLGPGSMSVAHQTGEFVPIAELQQCVALLKDAISRFCA